MDPIEEGRKYWNRVRDLKGAFVQKHGVPPTTLLMSEYDFCCIETYYDMEVNSCRSADWPRPRNTLFGMVAVKLPKQHPIEVH